MPATPDTGRPQETILAFDFGLRRIGVAVGQTVTGSANPLGVVACRADGPDWQAIGKLVGEWGAGRLVVGLPLNVDGTRSGMGERAEAFAAGLRQFDLPVETIDERYSSSEAQQMLADARRSGMRGRVRKETVDAAAAALIAERWLRERR